jgi:hypothetical protein
MNETRTKNPQGRCGAPPLSRCVGSRFYPRAEWRLSATKKIFSGLGVRAGVSDLLLWHAGRAFALELKPEGRRATEAQSQFLADMKNAGAFADVAVGLDAALRKLEGWGLLRGRVM